MIWQKFYKAIIFKLSSFPNALLPVREGADLCVANTTHTAVGVEVALCMLNACAWLGCVYFVTQHNIKLGKNWELGIMA